MEIRKLENPWCDDLEALVQALPMCWSTEDEMRIKPVDIVRNNDFENPEIGVTHMKDLFLDVTHWRYTSQVDQYRKAFSDDLAAARRACFLPELAAPYKPENVITGNFEEAVKAITRSFEGLSKVARLVPGNRNFQRRAFNATLNSIRESKDIRQEWAARESQRQARMREDAIKQTLGERYEETAWRLRAGEAVDDVLSEEEIARIKASLIPVDAQIQRDMQALAGFGGLWTKTCRFDGSHLNESNTPKKGGTSGED